MTKTVGSWEKKLVKGKTIKTFSMHFILTGEFFTEKIQRFVFERKLTKANHWMDNLKPRPTFDARQKLIKGEAQFKGATLCDDKNCDQCKPLRKTMGGFRYVEQPDKIYQRKIADHKEFIEKHYFVVDGDTDVSKQVVADLLVKKFTLDLVKEIRYRKDEQYERTTDRKLTKDFVEALDEYEYAIDNLYYHYQVKQGETYPVGTEDWKNKLVAESVMEIIKAKATYNDEIKEMIRETQNHGLMSATAIEKMYDMTMKGKQIGESSPELEKFANKMKRKPKSKPTTKTVKIGKYDVPENLLDDYQNCVSVANTAMMIYKSRHGTLDPIVEMERLQTRTDMHKAIFTALGLPYHQDIERHEKMTKKEKESVEFNNALSRYLDGSIDDNS